MPLALASRQAARCLAVAATALVLATWAALPPAHAAGPVRPNLVAGTAYLVKPGNLIDRHFYESFPHTADFGLTIDAALALAATDDNKAILEKIVDFIAHDGRDPAGKTVNYWTGIGTAYAAGGAMGKEALLAEVVGANPRDFGGHNLIAALAGSVCRAASPGSSGPCAGPGNYRNATSVFDQAYGILAQLRAGQARQAAAPIAFLEGLRNSDGSFPSLIPDSHDHDVDSTAMAVMALALVPTARARADVAAGQAWIASRQQASGGFLGSGGVSINSTGLAIQALSLLAARYLAPIGRAEAFLATAQNVDGGFSAYAGQRDSNVRASTQALSGAVGISFGTMRRVLTPTATRDHGGRAGGWLAIGVLLIAAMTALAFALRRRRRTEPGQNVRTVRDRVEP